MSVHELSSRAEARRQPRERYSGPAGRDLRIDILRGTAIVLFAVAVLAKVSNPGSRAFESTGTVTALALIITLEGTLIGMLYRPRAATNLGEATLRLWRRARAWYFTALGVVVAVILVGKIPGINTVPVTTLDTAAQPFLFGPPPVSASQLAIVYPLDPDVLLNIVLLRVGPWPLDVAVLACALFFIAPLVLLALARGKWAALVVVSLALYVAELLTDVRILPTRAEANLPLLGWQLVFTLGVVSGYCRRELVQWFRRGLGLVLFLILAIGAVVWLALPAVFSGQGVAIDLLAQMVGPQGSWLFEPSTPGPLRVVIPLALTVVAYGALTALWRPLSALVGWLLASIGSAVMPALVLLICAAVSTSSFAASNAVYLPTPVIAALIVLVMWTVALVWDRTRQERKQR